MEKIDFVVLWVDSNDPEWIASYNHYRPEKPITDKARFRDWGIFKYWFRCVEKYAPWVNKVFLITNGKFPDWINPNCEKLVLVKHSDYIPEKYLPTFNSKTIELNLGRLKELSEHFVYFNDDMFINAPITPQYYFKDGLPCDYNFESVFSNPSYSKQDMFSIDLDIFCNVAVINSNFNRRQVIRQAWKKWYGPHLWGKPLFFSLLLLFRAKFETFPLYHHEQPMLKSVFQEIWDKEPEILDFSCSRFRKVASLNQYIIRYWQFASNRFYPMKKEYLLFYTYNDNILNSLDRILHEERIPSLCLNDSPYFDEEEYKSVSEAICGMLAKKFPSPSIYEKA